MLDMNKFWIVTKIGIWTKFNYEHILSLNKFQSWTNLECEQKFKVW
jgi:hypothetical protein